MIKISLLISWFVAAYAIFIYSYGFVDFNLTLSSHPLAMTFVGWAQSLALFNRPVSTNVYLSLIIILFLLYIGTLAHWYNVKLLRFPWKPVILIALIFAVAYPFLSSDVFKYLFSARMVLDYGANPHVLPPNTFPDDTWIRFMRWVHTPSPYGPVMTGLAIPPYLLGLGKFVPTLFFYKFMALGWYILSVWLVGALAGQLTKDKIKVISSQLFFALNPLVLIEWLTNGHNDAPMKTLLLLSLYLLTHRKRVLSFTTLLLSIGIKYVTVFFLPFFFLFRRFSLSSIIHYSLAFLFLAPLLYHYSWQYQPWYVTWLVPFAAILGNPAIMTLVGAYTLGAFLRYLPFISVGLWEGSSQYFALLTFGPLGITAAILLARHIVCIMNEWKPFSRN